MMRLHTFDPCMLFTSEMDSADCKKRMVKSFQRKGLTGVVDAFPVYTH